MNPRISEQDEYLLSRLIDGDLPADEADALRRRMAAEPALAAAFDELTRVDDLVAERRHDEPAIDWDRFHAQVMEQVRLEPAPRAGTIRLSRWLTIGAPLAAAAAIALVVSISPWHFDAPTPGPVEPVTPTFSEPIVHVVTQDAELTASDGKVRVIFARAERSEQPEPVRFVRNETIAAAVREADRTDEENASSIMSVSTSSATVSLPELAVMAVPPLY